MASRLLITKSLALLEKEAADTEHGLKRALSVVDLTMLGVGAIIGAGIFVLTGVAAGPHAGAPPVLSFLGAGPDAPPGGGCPDQGGRGPHQRRRLFCPPGGGGGPAWGPRHCAVLRGG